MIRQEGLSPKNIAGRLLVSETFVKKVIRLYEATRSVSDPPRSKSNKRKISGKCIFENLLSEFHRGPFGATYMIVILLF